MVIKKYRLKPFAKKILTTAIVSIIVIAFINLICIACDRYIEMFNQCDEALGYTCDYYTARNYIIHNK